MQNTNAALRARVESFVAEMEELIRESALEAVQEALGMAGTASVRRTPTRASAMPGKRIRRSADGLAQIGASILDHVRANPGQGVEAISAALGMTSKELRRPIQMLIADGKLKTKGQKRGTTYFAGRGGSKPAAKRKTKASRKKASRKR